MSLDHFSSLGSWQRDQRWDLIRGKSSSEHSIELSSSGACRLAVPSSPASLSIWCVKSGTNSMLFIHLTEKTKRTTTGCHTLFEKLDFCPKIQFRQPPIFSRVFHPKKNPQFSWEIKAEFMDKNEDFEQCVNLTMIRSHLEAFQIQVQMAFYIL